MTKQLIVFVMLVSSALCEIYTLGDFNLLSSISEVRALCEDMKLIEDKGFSRHYSISQNDGFEWKLFFFKNDKNEYYLSQIHLIKDGTVYSDYVELSNEIAHVQGRNPDIIDTPGILPWYSSNWNSTYTHMGVIFNPKMGRILVELKLAR